MADPKDSECADSTSNVQRLDRALARGQFKFGWMIVPADGTGTLPNRRSGDFGTSPLCFRKSDKSPTCP
jgi:hypothetical protein